MNTREKLISLVGKDRLFPLFTTDIKKPSLVYTYTPVINDYVSQSQFEIKIIWNDYDETKAIEECLLNIFSNKESDDNFKIYKNIDFKASVSGGGMLFREDIQFFEDSIIFVIKFKQREDANI
ncbi:hypothetical protein EXN13_07420 [Clostridium botulinum]|nr:hypothetical protein [Clostridium botulinum]